jgi:hypothetical protein
MARTSMNHSTETRADTWKLTDIGRLFSKAWKDSGYYPVDISLSRQGGPSSNSEDGFASD